MADGVQHEIALRKYGWPQIIVIAIVWGYFSKDILYPLFILYNFVFCEFLDPDADQISLTKAEGDTLRTSKQYRMGLVGAIWVAYGIIYAYFSGLFGGHRSRFSHSIFPGTVTRMMWANIPVFYMVYNIGVLTLPPHYNIQETFLALYMDTWLLPYLSTQFVAWAIGDGIHLWKDGYRGLAILFGKRKGGNNSRDYKSELHSTMQNLDDNILSEP